MRKGDRVEVTDTEIFDDTKVGQKGEIIGYKYSIERWWDDGHPIDHKVEVRLDDGRIVTKFTSDLRRTY